jgi:inhibitor of KinA
VNKYPRILAAGDSALTVEFGDSMDEDFNRQARALDAFLNAQPFSGMTETVPTYRSLLVMYDPLSTKDEKVRAALARALDGMRVESLPEGRLIEIPVSYGSEFGPDLGDVAAYCGITQSEVIRLHVGPTYRAAMSGFAPGFSYLFGMPQVLSTPRLPTPRMRVEPGSVGIAGPQTGIYALQTPGGWRIIGRTQMSLFNPGSEDPFVLRAGDMVRFKAVD